MRTRCLAALLFVATAVLPCPAQPVYRIAVGGISAESNSFYPAVNDFNIRPVSSREEWLKESARGRGVLGGQIEVAARLGLQLYPIVSGRASFLGVVSGDSFEKHAAELIRQLKEANPRFDGVFLNLHGAMVVETYPHGDAELVRALSVGGTCSGEHGVGLGKQKLLRDDHGQDALDVMRSIKRALDPLDLMNPGKLLPR